MKGNLTLHSNRGGGIKRKKNGSWTKEACQEVALKCNTRSEFIKSYGSAYTIAVRNKWLDEICSHMKYLKTPDYSWTKEACHNVALKCKTRSEFIKKYPGAYDAARNKGIVDDICSHMISVFKPGWTKEACKKEASKYKTRDEYRNNSSSYYAAQRSGWLDEICSHMKRPGNRFNKLIYAYEFPDRSVYIGLTFNINDRQSHRDHDYRDAVTKHIKRTKLNPIRKILTDYISVDEAIKAESEYVEKYKIKSWKILNKAKAGAIGGNAIKWTFKTCQEEALKYKTRREFAKKNSSAYSIAYKNNWAEKVCSHMERLINPNGTWTKEVCRKEAQKYKYRSEFGKKSPGAYQAVCKNGWLDEICSHMILQQKPVGYWTKENCKQEAKKYRFKSEFAKESPSANQAARKNGWVYEICSHIVLLQKPNGYWTKENCHKAALKCKTRSEFGKRYSGAYDAARDKGILNDICSHMERGLHNTAEFKKIKSKQ